ncbi:MAG TPA: heme peroxidase family protein [Thermoanaerobaculia bacterium]|jgi:hypothetical protein
MKHHGITALRGIESSYHEEGRFGRLFPTAKPFLPDDGFLIELGKSMKETGDPSGDSRTIPAGFTFLGQFVAHDITFDTTSALDRQNDPAAIRDFRTPGLDLDCVYGSGPEASPFLYDAHDKHKLLLGTESNPYDVPRNRQGVALIGDPRNDVSLVTSQLQNLFLRFHDKVVDRLRAEKVPESQVFEEAQHLVRWHYQWILTHEFLPLVAGQDMVDRVAARGREIYHYKAHPFIPVEFAAAAYRYGHAQMRSAYKVNDKLTKARLFSDLGAFQEVTAERRVDWRNFFNVDPGRPPQASRKINTLVAEEMHHLPFVPEPDEDLHSIAVRNLLRGKALSLPSGQTAARRIGAEPLTAGELGFDGEAPLWYYILKEAEVRKDGETLGEVGGRIVCETFLGFLEADSQSYFTADRKWRPTLPSAAAGTFTMADLVRFTEG